jgi:hypothetical protein
MAYDDHRSRGRASSQQLKILDALEGVVGYSRRELAEVTGIELSSVCGRVNELLAIGMLIEKPARRCSITQRLVHPVRLPHDVIVPSAL